MRFLNLRRLLPSRSVWKVVTNKLQIKIHKLITSKAIKKRPKIIQSYTSSKRLLWPSLSTQPRKFKLNSKPHTLTHLQKTAPPILYIDHLLTEPFSTAKVQSKRQETGKGSDRGSDDNWESTVLNSPQMRGIDQRAEEFIARFRVQMHRQEMLARCL